jgi:hypothetical protein
MLGKHEAVLKNYKRGLITFREAIGSCQDDFNNAFNMLDENLKKQMSLKEYIEYGNFLIDSLVNTVVAIERIEKAKN